MAIGNGGYGNRPPGPRSGPGDRAPVAEAVAPYNFAPVSDFVFFPEWAQPGPDGRDRPLHDRPFEDGLCGTLELEIKATTPIFVRGERDQFFQGPDGPAIPGSSLRGMLRNVFEIATFSKLQRVNDHRYGLRDLQNQDLYVRRMADLLPVGPGGAKEPTPLVTAGWLERNPEYEPSWREQGIAPGDLRARPVLLSPCSFAKVEYGILQTLAKARGRDNLPWGDRERAPAKYKRWGTLPKPARETSLRVQKRNRGEAPVLGEYGVVVGSSTPGADRIPPVAGTLVFTGQPNKWPDPRARRPGAGGPKHHDFFFFDEQSRAFPLSQQLWDDFCFIHIENRERKTLTQQANPELAQWLDETGQIRDRMPVFFLMRDGFRPRQVVGADDVRAIGLAMMFRLAYRQTTFDAAQNAQPDVLKPGRDFAETVFGNVPDSLRWLERRQKRAGLAPAPALRGRVSFGMAKAVGAPKPTGPVTCVLGSPKASYYPHYVEQKTSTDAGRLAGSYKTFMDDDVKARGWKRYPVQGRTSTPALPSRPSGGAQDVSRVGTTFRPLPEGTTFVAPMRVHNLRMAELGALLWCLDFGGDPAACHTLGLAKSLGYGAVKIRVKRHTLTWNDPARREPVDLGKLVDEFTSTMEGALAPRGGWAKSPSLTELLTMARPASPDEARSLRHMRLDHPDYGNEFVGAKKQRLALAPRSAARRGHGARSP